MPQTIRTPPFLPEPPYVDTYQRMPPPVGMGDGRPKVGPPLPSRRPIPPPPAPSVEEERYRATLEQGPPKQPTPSIWGRIGAGLAGGMEAYLATTPAGLNRTSAANFDALKRRMLYGDYDQQMQDWQQIVQQQKELADRTRQIRMDDTRIQQAQQQLEKGALDMQEREFELENAPAALEAKRQADELQAEQTRANIEATQMGTAARKAQIEKGPPKTDLEEFQDILKFVQESRPGMSLEQAWSLAERIAAKQASGSSILQKLDEAKMVANSLGITPQNPNYQTTILQIMANRPPTSPKEKRATEGDKAREARAALERSGLRRNTLTETKTAIDASLNPPETKARLMEAAFDFFREEKSATPSAGDAWKNELIEAFGGKPTPATPVPATPVSGGPQVGPRQNKYR